MTRSSRVQCAGKGSARMEYRFVQVGRPLTASGRTLALLGRIRITVHHAMDYRGSSDSESTTPYLGCRTC